MSTELDPQGVRFHSVSPERIREEHWKAMHEISHDAFSEALADSRTQEEIDIFTGWPDLDSFTASRLDPQQAVGGRLNAYQTYKRPLVQLAFDGLRLVGFAYTADNVSGLTETARRHKEMLRWKNYRTARELVVDRQYQGLGFGHALGLCALKTAQVGQRFTTYTLPKELPKGDALARAYGGKPVGELQDVYYFGAGRAPAQQQRLVFTTAHSTFRRAMRQPELWRATRSIRNVIQLSPYR